MFITLNLILGPVRCVGAARVKFLNIKRQIETNITDSLQFLFFKFEYDINYPFYIILLEPVQFVGEK